MGNLAIKYADGLGHDDQTTQVLVVDDNAFDRKRLSRIIKRSAPRCGISEAQSLAEAQQVVERNRFDVVFADYKLTDGTGLDVPRFFQRKTGSIAPYMFLVTAHDCSSVARDALKHGFADYLAKQNLDAETIARLLSYTNVHVEPRARHDKKNTSNVVQFPSGDRFVTDRLQLGSVVESAVHSALSRHWHPDEDIVLAEIQAFLAEQDEFKF